VRGLHANGTKVVCYVTGGASQVRAWAPGEPMSMPRRQRRRRWHTHAHRPEHSCSLSPICCPQAVAWLLGVPGASATMLEVTVPYCRDSLVELLGEVRWACARRQAGVNIVGLDASGRQMR
jgi:hypothetical protein